MDQTADIHICGMCKSQFSSIDTFLSHKRSGCPTKQNHHLTGLPIANPSRHVPKLCGAMITPIPTNVLPCIPSSVPSRKSRRKPILLAATPKLVQPTMSSNSSPGQSGDVCTTLSSGQTFTDGAPGLPQTNNNSLTLFPDIAGESLTESNVAQETFEDGQTKCGLKGNGKGTAKPKCFLCTHEGCGFTTAHLKDIQRHERIHTGAKPFLCNFCHHRFTRKDKLQIHLRTHSGHKPFACSHCSYTCIDGGSLKKHLRTHTKERPFKCQICSYASRNSSQLTTHLRTHTGDAPFHCNLCTAKFKISTDLRRHKRIHTGEKPFKCPLCSYTSALNSNLKSHMQHNHLKEKSFQCEDCNFTCCTKRQLRQHENTHSTRQPIKCLECDFICLNKRAFRRHERTHSKEKPHKCSHCSFTAKYLRNISTHIKKLHPDLSKVKLQKQTLQRTRVGQNIKPKEKKKPKQPKPQILSGKKTYSCDKCDASFMRKDSFASHRRQHDRVANSMVVLQLQQLPPMPSPDSMSTAESSMESTANQNQNNNIIFSDLNTTPSTDIEMLLSVINSQVVQSPISSDPERPDGNSSRDAETGQGMDIVTAAVSLQKQSKLRTSSAGNTNATQSNSLMIIQPEAVNGDMVTLQVISCHADASKVAPHQARGGFNVSEQNFVIQQLSMSPNQQLPQSDQPVTPTIQESSKQPVCGKVNQTPHITVPTNKSQRIILPQVATRSSFPTNSLMQGLVNSTSLQGTRQHPKPVVQQSFLQQNNSTSSQAANHLLADAMRSSTSLLPDTTMTSPQITQRPLLTKQNMCMGSSQMQACIQSQRHVTSARTNRSPAAASTLQNLTTYSSWNSHISSQMGQLIPQLLPPHDHNQQQQQQQQQQQEQQQVVQVSIHAAATETHRCACTGTAFPGDGHARSSGHNPFAASAVTTAANH